MSVFLGSLVGRKLIFVVVGILFDILAKKYGWNMPDTNMVVDVIQANAGLIGGVALGTQTAAEDFAKHLAAGKQKSEAAAEKERLSKK